MNLINFPLWKNDGKPFTRFSKTQINALQEFNNKLKNNEYRHIKNDCLCGTDSENTVISEKDRYGLPVSHVLCSSCGLIRTDVKLDHKSLAGFYANEYRSLYGGSKYSSDKFFTEQYERGNRFIGLLQAHVELDDIKNVFEIGCGAGGVLYAFSEMGKTSAGCDYGESYLKYGKEKGLSLYSGSVDLDKTPECSQDLLILSHVLEHFEEPISELNKIIPIIKSGGYLLVEVPGIFNIYKVYPSALMYFQNAHLYNYYYNYLVVFFEELGLDVVYGNETCTFILKKPDNWLATANDIKINDPVLKTNVDKIKKEFKKIYLTNLLKINPYVYRSAIIRLLDKLNLLSFVKSLLK